MIGPEFCKSQNTMDEDGHENIPYIVNMVEEEEEEEETGTVSTISSW